MAGDGRRRVEFKLDCIADLSKRDIYWALRAGPATAAEVAAELGVGIEKVRYQIRSMRKAGVLEAVGKTRRRGVSEGLFRVCDEEMMIEAAELSSARRSLVERSHSAFIARMWNEVRVSAEGRGRDVDRRLGHPTKVDLLLDARGWTDAARLLTDAAAEVKSARDRLLPEDGRPAGERQVFLILFETLFPDPRPAPASRLTSSDEPDLLVEPSRTQRPPGSRQLEVLKFLSFRSAGVLELADRLLLPVHKVKRDLRSMRSRGLVFVCDERPRRNTVEHVYALDPGRREAILDDLDDASPRQLLEHDDALTRSACGDLVEAMRSGALRKRSDYVLMRIPLLADDEAIDLAGGILRRAFAATLRVGEASRSRLQMSGEVPTCAQSTILFSSSAAPQRA